MLFFLLLFLSFALVPLSDLYALWSIRRSCSENHFLRQAWIRYALWGTTLLFFACIGCAFTVFSADFSPAIRPFRALVMGYVMVVYLTKIFVLVTLMLLHVLRMLKQLLPATDRSVLPSKVGTMSRAEFLTSATLLTGTLPLVLLSKGMFSGAYDYRIHRHTLHFPQLPRAFDGLRIAQISDIHVGSFFDKAAVQRGVDMLLQEKPDLVLFTGDLVNEQTRELADYLHIFQKVRAPLGVYSVLGNHDYGHYRRSSSEEERTQDFKDMLHAHFALGWHLLRNQHHRLRVSGEELGIVGVENWGSGRFPKYGRLDEALKGTEDLSFKLLMSHDPTHWKAKVLPESNIDLTLSGHTHGFQMGVEWGTFRWSPAQYRYPQWAGMYQHKKQYLYVNRGFGFIGYPGRVGILPEITVLELKRGPLLSLS